VSLEERLLDGFGGVYHSKPIGLLRRIRGHFKLALIRLRMRFA
jgi:hypothetical protein